MKIKVLIPKNNLCDIGLLIKELKKEKFSIIKSGIRMCIQHFLFNRKF